MSQIGHSEKYMYIQGKYYRSSWHGEINNQAIVMVAYHHLHAQM